MSQQTIRVGFVGCGLIARSHARGLASVPGVTITAVHDLDRARADAFALDHAGSLDAVVDDPDAVIAASDVVYVCTWTSAHPEAVIAVARAGKPVFCEKPLAVDLAAATAMTEAVAEAGITNQVGLVLRNSPAFRWLQQRVRQLGGGPEPGPIMNIVFRDDQYLPVQGMYHSTWRGDRTKAGAGALLEHSIHDLDLLRWLMGPIVSVSAHLGTMHGLDGIDDQASVLVLAESGAQATLTSVWHDVLSRPSQRRVEVFCQQALFTVTGDWVGPVTTETGQGGEEQLAGERLTDQANAVDGLGVNADAAFIDAVRSGSDAYPDFAVALEAHRLADAAYRSADSGGQPTVL